MLDRLRDRQRFANERSAPPPPPPTEPPPPSGRWGGWPVGSTQRSALSEVRWSRLVRVLFGLRQLQRNFADGGRRLQTLQAPLNARLKKLD